MKFNIDFKKYVLGFQEYVLGGYFRDKVLIYNWFLRPGSAPKGHSKD